MSGLTTGGTNCSFGQQSAISITTTSGCRHFGNLSGANDTGTNNSSFGSSAGTTAGGLSNATAIGSGARVAANNTVQLGRAGTDLVSCGSNISVWNTIKRCK